MKIVLLGAPGTGKGTQAQFISQQYNLPIISTGNILRKLIKKNNVICKIINNYMKKGELVPDTIVTEIIINYISNLKFNNGFILDGFPRTVIQAKELKKTGINVNYVFEFTLSKNKIIQRLKNRRIDPKTGFTYNINDLNKNNSNKFNDLIIRKDDQTNIVNKRFKEYEKTIHKLIEFFMCESKINSLKYYKINTDNKIIYINQEIKKILNVNRNKLTN